MSPTVLLVSDRVSDRPSFEDAWRDALVEVGLQPRVVAPHSLAEHASDNSAFVIDAGCAAYDEDELLAAVGLLRALHAAVAVVLPENGSFGEIEDLLEDLCGGLLVRSNDDVRRVARTLARRRDATRSKRFEYITVSPRPSELLAVLGDGSAALLRRPVSGQDDGSEVATITLAGDAHSATLKLGSGHEITLQAASLGAANGSKSHSAINGEGATISIDGARLGARLRELRLAAGLTQAELARRTGIHRPNIARVEAGRHTPSLETLARLASAIGVSTTVVLAEG
ncbi:MAG TPA: helix-turn-helix transcriptional regulator [Polyangiales bacterium]